MPRIGRLESVGIGKEASRGVGVPASHTLPRIGYTFDDKSNKVVSSEVLGHISGNGNQAVNTALFSEGNIDGEVNVNSFGLILLALFGSESVSTVSGAKKHAYSLVNSNQHQSLSIHLDSGDGSILDRIYEGCVLDSLELNIVPDDFVKFVAGVKGRKGQDSSFTPAYAEDFKFIGRDVTVKIASDTSGLAGASGLSLKEVKLSIQKNADYNFTLGTLEPENIPNKQIVVQGTITLDHESSTFRDYMLNGDYKALSIHLNNTRDAISTNTPQMYFELPVVEFFEWERDNKAESIITQTINFRALLDLSTGTPRLFSDAYIINAENAY